MPVNVGAMDVELLEVLLDEMLDEEELLDDVMLDELLEEAILEVVLSEAELELLLVEDGAWVLLWEWLKLQPTAVPMTTAPRSNDLMSFFIFFSFLDSKRMSTMLFVFN